jgi:acyl-CoA thioesterase
MTEHMGADEIAKAVGAAMYDRDMAAQAMGITLDEVKADYSRMSMAVRPDMANGLDTCHGGMIFTLADTAFAYACNSHNRITVAQHCTITFLKPAKVGDILTATARQNLKVGRNAVTDIVVTRQDGEAIATFRGNSFTTQGEVVPNLGRDDA